MSFSPLKKLTVCSFFLAGSLAAANAAHAGASLVGSTPPAMPAAPTAIKNAPLPPERPSFASDCNGLTSPAGQFSANLVERRKVQKRACGSQMKSAMGKLKEKLLACDNLGKSGGSTNSMSVASNIFPMVEERVKNACDVNEKYLKTSERVCDSYGYTAGKLGNIATDGTQKEQLASTQTAYSKASNAYANYGAYMNTESQRIKNKLPNLGDKEDQYMDTILNGIQKRIASRAASLEAQAKAKLAQRKDSFANSGSTLRFGTNADVKQFYVNLDKCKSAIRAGGELEQLKKFYKEGLGKSVVSASKESGFLKGKFNDQSNQFQASADKAEAAKGSLTEGSRTPSISAPSSMQDMLQKQQARKEANQTMDGINNAAKQPVNMHQFNASPMGRMPASATK